MPPLSQSIRTALGDLYAAHQMKNFDLVWPPELLQVMQAPLMQPPQPGMPPQPGAPPPEAMAQAQQQSQPLADQFGFNAAPETAEEDEKVSVS